MTYAIYMRRHEDTTLNAFTLGFGNNSMSLLAGIMVLCTAFALRPDIATEIMGQGNEGLTFIWMPQLFGQMPAGRFFMAFFFLALVFAAWTSLISMIGGGAQAAAARARQREEEEVMTGYSNDELAEKWEFKIIRSGTGAFRHPEKLRKALDQEAQAGWELAEKFDKALEEWDE